MRGTMQSNRWLRRAALLVTGTAALAAGPATASAANVGSASFGNTDCNPGFTWTDTTYVLPAGNVTAFSYQSGNGSYYGSSAGQQLDFKVLRQTAPGTYAIVGSSGVKTLATSDGTVETFATAPILAQAGDVIGFWVGDAALSGCTNYPGSESEVGYSGADPAVGQTVVIAETYGHLNVAATTGPAGPTCNGKTPTIMPGSNSPQTINGTNGDDVIYSGNGDDTINGNGGNDTICGVGGADKIRGGNGDDYVFGGPGGDDLGGNLGNDSVVGGAGNDRVNGTEGNDFVAGGDGDDIANGGDGDDRVHGGANNDVLAGNAGIDECVGNAGDDRATTNGGCETISSADVSNNTAAPTSAQDAKVVASANDPDDANGNAAALMPATDANSGLDVDGGNSTPFGDGV